jgi:hypothetical protein
VLHRGQRKRKVSASLCIARHRAHQRGSTIQHSPKKQRAHSSGSHRRRSSAAATATAEQGAATAAATAAAAPQPPPPQSKAQPPLQLRKHRGSTRGEDVQATTVGCTGGGELDGALEDESSEDGEQQKFVGLRLCERVRGSLTRPHNLSL